MEREILMIIALTLAWGSGLLFGLGITRQSFRFERDDSNGHRSYTDHGAPNELPMTQIESDKDTHGARSPMALITRNDTHAATIKRF